MPAAQASLGSVKKKAMETALLAFLGFGAAVFTLGAWMYASLSQDRSR